MNKHYILILIIASLIFESCKKDTIITDDKYTAIINGWEITKITNDFNINARDLFFINSEIGFVVGYNGDIYKTINSGVAWQKQNSGTSLHLYSAYFVNQNIGFVSGEAMNGCLNDDCDKGGVFLKTTDGGNTWTKKLFKEFISIKSLHFFNEKKGLAIIYTPDIPNSRDYSIAKTDNGGDSWDLIDLAIMPTYDKFYSVENTIYIAGENQKIYKSSDYGENWETITTPISAGSDVRNLYFYNETIGFIDGVSDIYKTTDGGLNWETTNFPFSSFGVLHFNSETEGFNIETVSAYEGGDFPTFKGSQSYQTSNGGDSWTKSDLDKNIQLGLTFFPEKDLGYGINSSNFYSIKKQ